MSLLLRTEVRELPRLGSVRAGLALLAACPLLWAYAPGIFEAYGVALVSGFQVPALSLVSSMAFLLPLLVAVAAAELVGIETTHRTLATVLLRPLGRARWLLSKALVASLCPFVLLGFLLLVGLAAGLPLGYGTFTGGTGLGDGGLIGQGAIRGAAAGREVATSYLVAACSLVPVALLAVLATVATMRAAGGVVATIGVLVAMRLLAVVPGVEPFLLTPYLSAYLEPGVGTAQAFATLAFYALAFLVAAVVLFERKGR